MKPYRILRRNFSDAVMSYMINATDHSDVPLQLARANRKTVRPEDPCESKQRAFDFDSLLRKAGASASQHKCVPSPGAFRLRGSVTRRHWTRL